MIFPIQRGLIECVEPVVMQISDDRETEAAYRAWAQSRESFNKELKVKGSAAERQKWQKDYFRGTAPESGKAPANHRTKVQVKPFK